MSFFPVGVRMREHSGSFLDFASTLLAKDVRSREVRIDANASADDESTLSTRGITQSFVHRCQKLVSLIREKVERS
jgi:hypothetical protein